METIKGFKGFDKNLKCRNYQYEVGKDFEETGNIKACSNGFHFCENPADIFSYYPPSDSGNLNRYCEVEGTGKIDKDSGDSKIACSKIHISAEIGIKGLINAWVKFILDKVNWDDSKATNTGYQSAAIVDGKDSIAIVTGKDSKAKGVLDSWIVLTERGNWDGETYPILSVQAFKVDGKYIKEDTFYKLVDGKPKEVE